MIAELRFGRDLPLLQQLLYPAIQYLLRRRLAALKQHMHEERRNLRTQLEMQTTANSALLGVKKNALWISPCRSHGGAEQ